MKDIHPVIRAARETLERLQRQEQDEALSQARAIVRDWPAKPQEPPKPAQKLDTTGPTIVSEAVLTSRLQEQEREIVRLVAALADADERAHAHAEDKIRKQARALKDAEDKIRSLQTEMLRMEARLANRIAGLAKLMVAPSASDSSNLLDAGASPQGRSRIN